MTTASVTLKGNSSSAQVLADECFAFTLGTPVRKIREIIRTVDVDTVPRMKEGNKHCPQPPRSSRPRMPLARRAGVLRVAVGTMQAKAASVFRVAGN